MGENMEEAKSSEDVPKKGRSRSLRSYASRVFQESSAGMVSSLAQTSSTKRRVFKVLTLIACLIGFLYQTGQFLAVVFQYPTSIGINVIRPDTFDGPAFTFCDNNAINRKMFCEEFPEKCEKPDEVFCKKFEYYCDENRTLVPKKKFYSLAQHLSLEEMVNLNANVTDFVQLLETGLYFEGAPIQEITGPFLRTREFLSPYYLCYSVNDRVNNSLLPQQVTFDVLARVPVNKFVFSVQPYDVFVPGDRPGILFDIHSPFQAVNPLETGIFMKAGRSYMVFVSMEEEILQQAPYDTQCVNYTEIWIQNGYSGPRLQDMCRQNCIADISVDCFKCVVPSIYYPRDEKYCRVEDMRRYVCDLEIMMPQVYECRMKCRGDCRRVKYSYTVQERLSHRFDEDGEFSDNIDHSITVEVFLKEEEMVVLKHSPKYMIVEVFSNIGGFIGCWLGINLLDITDIFEGFFRIFRYSF